MGFPYRFNEQAHEEYIETYGWYEEKQAGLGDRFMNSVEKCYNKSVNILNILESEGISLQRSQS